VPTLRKLLRPYLAVSLAYTVALNLLHLVSPLFMLQIYDRVLTSGSWDTLIFHSSIAIALLSIYAFAEAGRRRVFALAADAIGRGVQSDMLHQSLSNPNLTHGDRLGILAHLTNVQRTFFNGTIAPVFDLPFAPLFLLLLFLIHPLLGAISLVGIFVLCVSAYIGERRTSATVSTTRDSEQAVWDYASQLLRNRSAIVGMGMERPISERWRRLQADATHHALSNADQTGFFAGIGRSGRMILQALILAFGAGLVLSQQMSPGSIVAASLILGRALAPVDQIIGTLRQLTSARQAAATLNEHLDVSDLVSDSAVTPMTRPEPKLELEELSVGVPSQDLQLVPPMTHSFAAGSVVVVLGASGSGKSTFLKTLVATHPPLSGHVRLGGRSLDGWQSADRGLHIGYLPQDTQLLHGTVRENIGRFGPSPRDEIEEAARLAGAHDLILRLPNGYDTLIGENGHFLSGGARQSIGLARAIFDDPALVVLDEPTASMDQVMRQHFTDWLKARASAPLADRAQTVFLATHDPNITQYADQVLILQNRQAVLMSKQQYVEKIKPLRSAASSAVNVTELGGDRG